MCPEIDAVDWTRGSWYISRVLAMEVAVKQTFTMVYWKGKKFWLGKLVEHPEIMSQGTTIRELEANLRDAYRMMVLDDVPKEHREKAIAV